MVASLKSTTAAIALLHYGAVPFTNAMHMCSFDCIPVEHDDYIYNNVSSSSPIVIDKYRLIFFPVPEVADTLFVVLFRRMMGYKTWKSFGIDSSDGLVRLSDFSIDEATHMMNSPEYTRAIFLRDPKDRFLSTYLDKVLNDDASIEQSCCPQGERCLYKHMTVTDFATLIQTCSDKHWMPMSSLIDTKFIPKLNFVGHLENAQADTRSLLEKVGGWERFGVSGWGKHGNETIFATRDKLNDVTASETSDSWHLMSKLFTPHIESILELYYAVDYSFHEFGLAITKIPFSDEDSRKAVPIVMFDTDGTLERQENSTVGTFLKTNVEAETASCALDWNQTNSLEPLGRGLFIDDLTGLLFDQGRVLGLLVHWNV